MLSLNIINNRKISLRPTGKEKDRQEKEAKKAKKRGKSVLSISYPPRHPYHCSIPASQRHRSESGLFHLLLPYLRRVLG
jgi:hypothetical protein